MSATLAHLGNSLHDGTRSVPIVRRRRTWYLISVAAVLLLGTLAVLRGPNLGIEFTGGSEFQISGVQDTSQTAARDIVREHVPDSEPKVTVLGGSTVRVNRALATARSIRVWPGPCVAPAVTTTRSASAHTATSSPPSTWPPPTNCKPWRRSSTSARARCPSMS